MSSASCDSNLAVDSRKTIKPGFLRRRALVPFARKNTASTSRQTVLKRLILSSLAALNSPQSQNHRAEANEEKKREQAEEREEKKKEEEEEKRTVQRRVHRSHQRGATGSGFIARFWRAQSLGCRSRLDAREGRG